MRPSPRTSQCSTLRTPGDATEWSAPIAITEQLPPIGEPELALEHGATEWWQAQYFPAEDGSDPNDGVSGWEFVGDDADLGREPVTHWLPMPRVRQRSNANSPR